MRAPLALPLAALLAGACGIPEHGPMMEPGNDCMDCHGSEATSFTAAGTVYSEHTDPADAGLQNVRVQLVGADGLAGEEPPALRVGEEVGLGDPGADSGQEGRQVRDDAGRVGAAQREDVLALLGGLLRLGQR